jgi:hypothetical protein
VLLTAKMQVMLVPQHHAMQARAQAVVTGGCAVAAVVVQVRAPSCCCSY